MNMTDEVDKSDGRDLAAWTAIIAALMMLATLALNVVATGGDGNLIFDPERALALAPEKIAAYRMYLLTDTFGFYLPWIVIGGYLRRRLRDQGGVVIDIALLFIVVHAILGATGAAIPFATLAPLAEAHANGDAAIRSAAEIAWLGIVLGSASGIWVWEGPVMAFWGIATGLAMRAQGMKLGMLTIVIGVLYAGMFVFSCADFPDLMMVCVVLMGLASIVWAVGFGITLLREKSSSASPASPG